MEQATTIGLDIAKHVFQVHGADAGGHALLRRRIVRSKLIGFLSPALTTGFVRSASCAIACD